MKSKILKLGILMLTTGIVFLIILTIQQNKNISESEEEIAMVPPEPISSPTYDTCSGTHQNCSLFEEPEVIEEVVTPPVEPIPEPIPEPEPVAPPVESNSYGTSYTVINENYGVDYVTSLNMNCSINGCYEVYEDANNYLMHNGFYAVILPAELKPQHPPGSTLQIEFTNEYGESSIVGCLVIDYRSTSHGNTIGFNQSNSPYMYEGQWTARIVY